MSGVRGAVMAPHVALGATVAFGLTVGTQWAARGLAYGPALGHAVYRASASTARWWIVAAVVLVAAAAASVWLPGIRRGSAMLAVVAACAAWVAQGRPVYAPWMLIVWHVTFWKVPLLLTAVRQGWVAVAYGMPASALATLPLLVGRRTALAPTASHGSAVWDRGDVLLRPSGLLLGWQDVATRRRTAT